MIKQLVNLYKPLLFPLTFMFGAFVFLFAGSYFYLNLKDPRISSTLTPKTVTETTPESENPASNVLTNYFPLKKGNYWEYEGIKREQLNAENIETSNVKKKVEVIDVQKTDGGIIVSLEGEPDYLIKGNNVYSRESWGDELILQFPLHAGQKLEDDDSLQYRDDDFYVWHVEEKLSKTVLGRQYDECFKISYKTLPDTSYYVFCYGMGIVEEGYKHNGTVLELNYKLINSYIN